MKTTNPAQNVRYLLFLGLEERTARRVVSQCIDKGFIVSKSSRAPLCIAIPVYTAPHIFPGLLLYWEAH